MLYRAVFVLSLHGRTRGYAKSTRKSPRNAWAKVREVIGRSGGRDHTDVEGITAQMLNDHDATTLTDRHYKQTTLKLTVLDQRICITEIEVFHMLDKLRPTAAGLSGIRYTGMVFAAWCSGVCDFHCTAV